ncbi:HxsD-like protein [Patescibacteria group bacterium]|nr:HxsD-like protein [Patescibacteria group bacterium]
MKVNFNKKFYNLRVIKKAARTYQGLADFKINQTKELITVSLENIRPEVKNTIKDEFSNYVLAMMKQ